MSAEKTADRTQPVQEVWDRPFVRMHQRWCDDFVIELRLRDVPGPRIGDHLAEVESHCIETGTDPQEAFGDPTAYARETADAAASAPDSGIWRVTAVSLLGLIVFLTGTDATQRWASGQRLSYNALELAASALMLVGLAALPLLLGALIRRRAFGIGYLSALLAAGVLRAAASLVPLEPLVDGVPAAPVAIGGFVVVCVLAVLQARELSDDDLVTSPLPPASESRRTGWRPDRALPWLFPVFYVLLGALSWFTA